MKTLTGWYASKQNLSDYLNTGDLIDDGLEEFIVCVLPPIYPKKSVIQMGEPASHVWENGKYVPTFMTIRRKRSARNQRACCVYEGIMTTAQAKAL